MWTNLQEDDAVGVLDDGRGVRGEKVFDGGVFAERRKLGRRRRARKALDFGSHRTVICCEIGRKTKKKGRPKTDQHRMQQTASRQRHEVHEKRTRRNATIANKNPDLQVRPQIRPA